MDRAWTTVRVVGPSMEPAMASGEWWLVIRYRRYRLGQVVALRHPDRDDLLLVKRIVRQEPSGYWVEGDNPSMSQDSRAFGIVPAERIIGRLVLRYRRAPRQRGQ